MIVALLTLGVLLFVALVVVASLVVPIVVVIKRGGIGDAPGLGPPGLPRPPRRHDSWWADAARSPWADGDSHGHGDSHGDSSSCGSGSGGGSSCGGGSSSSCGGSSG